MISLNAYSTKKKIVRLISTGVFILLMVISIYLILSFDEQSKREEAFEVSLVYHNLVDELQDFTNQNISLLSGFSAYIQMREVYTDKEIYTYLDYLLEDHLDVVRNIGILEDTTIRWAYPVEENKDAIGVDLSQIPGQSEAVLRVKNNLETLFQGPVDLVQGGSGIIVRMPLLKRDTYWGMVSIVLRAEKALEFIDDFAEQNQVAYLITRPDKPDDIIYGQSVVLSEDPLKFKLNANLGGWDVYSVPSSGWTDDIYLKLGQGFTALIINGTIAFMLYKWLIKYSSVLKDKNELEQKYMRDRFTGVYTREYFNQRAEDEFHLAERHKYPLSLIYFDLDHFKQVNDTYGHASGDRVLLQVVETVKTLIRSEDVFSRWGGDEFIILLPHTDAESVVEIAQRIRIGIENIDICKEYGVTASIGCAEWVLHEYIQSWFARTDKALYQSKNDGRNRVTIHKPKGDDEIVVKVIWDSIWNSNNATIDQEHKSLLNHCNDIIETALYRNEYDEMLRMIEHFILQMKAHFESEMKIIREAGYPDISQHTQLHIGLLRQAEDLYSRAAREEIKPSELYQFLMVTLIKDHIRKDDIKYYKYLESVN